jgi:hypothetical protein
MCNFWVVSQLAGVIGISPVGCSSGVGSGRGGSSSDIIFPCLVLISYIVSVFYSFFVFCLLTGTWVT